MHLRGCPKCQSWMDAEIETCPTCGFELLKERRAEIKKRQEVDDLHIPIWRINISDPLWLKIVKRPIQIVQLLLYAIVGFFIYLSTSLAH